MGISVRALNDAVVNRSKGLRVGQALSNVLYDADVEGADKLYTTDYDPYQMDDMSEYAVWMNTHATIVDDEVVAIHA